ncbi:hypothetical protein H072_5161 [Dactylellina haptotyla CBS 200.50]|uniref:Uncharacterized protein n=1 Tax=Dactylellina haptotyla (strain CBS 200.50) TaxID=1284197 RepID=S8BNC3_DACHA|nr:hypothetical protein H072_5161 [Dactylellina haptotyla CBS 200.50]
MASRLSQDLASSHGRGGAGNIAPDDTEYADGGIVRAATPSGNYSTGRGGGGNVGHSENARDDHDVVPDSAQVNAPQPTEGHGVSTGRGGGGNIVTSEDGEKHVGLADKLKEKIFGHK